MSLGALGQYGSDSSISDSGEEEQDKEPIKQVENSNNSVECVDPLSLKGIDSADTSSSCDDDSLSVQSPGTSSENNLSSNPSLPLPDIDDIVARNSSYSGSELHSSVSSNSTEASVENSVFMNPFEQSEAAKIAILKKHVSEFDKKPATRGPSPTPGSKRQHRKNNRKSLQAPADRHDPGSLFDDNDSSLGTKKEHTHRCGVTDSLQPPKKYMKMYDRVYK